VRVSEWVSFAYFVYLLAVALVKAPWPRRGPAVAATAAASFAALVPLTVPDTGLARIARDWLPTLFLTIGYWLSGWYFVAPMPRIEAQFLAWDWRVLGRDGGASLVLALPRAAIEALEFAYVGCFLFVPGGMLILAITGHASAADHFWTLVLAAELGSFAFLPWIQTRPPRSLETAIGIERRPLLLRQVNRLMVKHTSIGVNTFPSGHVAGALATAIAVSEVQPGLWPWMVAGALLIAIASVIGRYHYFVDAVTGAALTLAAWGVISVLWP
jgi:membrane-associated phospholipid phosphatase